MQKQKLLVSQMKTKILFRPVASMCNYFPPSRLVSLDLLLDLLHCLHLKCCLGRGAEDREVTVPKGRVRGGVGADCKTASTSQPDLSRLKTLTPARARRLGAEKTSPERIWVLDFKQGGREIGISHLPRARPSYFLLRPWLSRD